MGGNSESAADAIGIVLSVHTGQPVTAMNTRRSGENTGYNYVVIDEIFGEAFNQ